MSSSRSEAEEHLLTVLGMVNEWLRFAEAKNAGLIALGSLSLTGLLTYAAGLNLPPKGAVAALVVGCALWLGSICLATYSFMPQTNAVNSKLPLKNLVDESDNLFYFGHLANFSSQALLTALGSNQNGDNARGRFENDLAGQVIINSRITVSKLDLFDSATRWWLAGLLVVSAGVLWTLLGG